MNRKQRDANRQTAREARRNIALSDWFAGRTFGKTQCLAVLSSGHFTRGTTSRPAFFCVDDLECSAPAAAENAPEFATALDRVWVSTSVLSPIRYIDATAKEPT